MKKFFVVALCLIILLSTTCFAADFLDLASEHWAYKNVMNLVDKGIVSGYPDGTYRPDKTITRGEFFKLIMVAMDGEEIFELPKKLAKTWAEPYMKYAESQGLMMNGTTTEDIDSNMTRLEMAVVLSKVATYKKIEKAYSDDGMGVIETTTFNDVSSLSEMEQRYIQSVADLGLIRGYSDGSFKPNNSMTRAEIATVIYRFLTIK